MFCKRCASLTRTLTFDSAAGPRAELMSGSCIWGDEIHRGWCIQCILRTREVFHLRYMLTAGEPVPSASVEYFRELEQQFPNWPLFRPERRSAEIAELVRRMVHGNTRQVCIGLEGMDREYRKRQSKVQAPDAEPGAQADPGPSPLR